MATEQNLQSITLVAAADLSAKQFYGVTVDANGKAALAGAGARIEGVLQNKPASAEAGTVAYAGVTKAVLGATVAAGANVSTDANGKFITSTTGAFIAGTALEGGDANEVVSVLLVPGGVAP